MPSIYCPSCGQPNQHSGIKPKFCGHCAQPLTLEGGGTQVLPPSQTVASRRNKTPIGRRPIIEDDDDGETMTDGTLPDIKKLELEITVDEPYRVTPGEIWGAGSLGLSRPTQTKKVNKKEVLDGLKKSIFEKKVVDLNPND